MIFVIAKRKAFQSAWLRCCALIAALLFLSCFYIDTARADTQEPFATANPTAPATPAPASEQTATPPPRLEDNRNWVHMILRARQLKEVYWYALADIEGGHAPNEESLGHFYAGMSYFGIPYAMGSRYVASTGAFAQFLKESKDADSLFYQTRRKKENYIAPAWGADCSSFVSFAWGLSGRYTTLSLTKDTGGRVRCIVRRGQGAIACLADLNQICPGDAFIYRKEPDGHVRLVVSVTREGDADPFDTSVPIIGMIVWEQINMTASSYVAVTTYGEGGLQPQGDALAEGDWGVHYSLTDLLDKMQNGTEDPLDDYGIYRLKDFNSKKTIISYTPNPYVPLSLEEALVGDPFLGTPRLLGNRTENGVTFAATLACVPPGGEEIHFILEASKDGEAWDIIARETRKTPSGTTLMPLSCLLTDADADPSTTYHYRVRAEFTPTLLDWGSENNPRGLATSYTQYSKWSEVLVVAGEA